MRVVIFITLTILMGMVTVFATAIGMIGLGFAYMDGDAPIPRDLYVATFLVYSALPLVVTIIFFVLSFRAVKAAKVKRNLREYNEENKKRDDGAVA